MTTVVIADPDPSARYALARWLEHKFGIDDVVLLETGECLVAYLEGNSPDVVMLEWSLPDRPGPDFCREVQARGSAMQWIILSSDPEVSRSVSDYPGGFIQKGSSLDEITSVLQDILKT